MLGHVETVNQAEEPAGPRLLESYISLYLQDRPKHLRIQEKKALRICCKRFKVLFNAAITSAVVGNDIVNLPSKSKLIRMFADR